MTYEQLQQMITELETASFAILDAQEREHIEGVKFLLHMQEAVSTEAAMKVKKIYDKFQKAMHLAMKTRG